MLNCSIVSPMRVTTRTINALATARKESVEQLSTGKRVDTASDDMGALSVSTKLSAKDNSLRMAMRNINDAISMVTTADSGMGHIQQNLTRIRELAIQSANGHLGDTDRTLIQKEAAAQLVEIDSLTKSTQFNGIPLLNNDGSSANWSPVVQYDLSSLPPSAYTRNGALNGQGVTSIGGRNAWQQTSDWNQLWIPMPALSKPCAKISIDMYIPSTQSASGSIDTFARHVGYNGTANTVSAGFGNRPVDYMAASESGNQFAYLTTPIQEDAWVNITIEASTVSGEVNFSIGGTTIAQSTASLFNLANDKIKLQSNSNSWQPSGVAWSNLEVSESDSLGGDGIKIQAGSETADNLNTTVTVDVTLSTLDISTIDLTTVSGAQAALSSLESAMSTLSSRRADIGASMNRLMSQLDQVQHEATTTTEATSKMVDLDFAKASADFAQETTKLDINLKAQQLQHHIAREKLTGLLKSPF